MKSPFPPTMFLNPVIHRADFATKSQEFVVEMTARPFCVYVTLRNARTGLILLDGRLFLQGRWTWGWRQPDKGITIPPGLRAFAQEQTEKFVRDHT